MLASCFHLRTSAKAQGGTLTLNNQNTTSTGSSIPGIIVIGGNTSGGSFIPGPDGTYVWYSNPTFFAGEQNLFNSVYYLAFPNGRVFGYYARLSDPHYIYHYDMGFEYVVDAADGHNGVYLYDFKSGTFFYTSPSFSFPYLYDFTQRAFLYYFPDPTNPQRYNTNGVRYFYNFATGQVDTR